MADLARLHGGGFLVIGRAGMDLYADPPGTPLEEGLTFTAALGGSSANIAAGLCRLGCDAALVTCVSDDAVGRWCEGQLDRYGIDRRFVRRVGGEARNSLAVVDTRGTETQAVLYRNGAADLAMDRRDVDDLPYSGWSALVVAGTVLAAQPARDAACVAIVRAREAGLPVIVDLDYRPYSWASAEEAADAMELAARMADVVVGNDVEFGVLARAGRDGIDAARDLVEGAPRLVIYKMGEDGAIRLSAEGEARTGVFETEVLKPTGAGDSFLAGFLAGLAEGRDVDEAVRRGSACAAIVVSRVGCAPAMPTEAELDAFLARARMRAA